MQVREGSLHWNLDLGSHENPLPRRVSPRSAAVQAQPRPRRLCLGPHVRLVPCLSAPFRQLPIMGPRPAASMGPGRLHLRLLRAPLWVPHLHALLRSHAGDPPLPSPGGDRNESWLSRPGPQVSGIVSSRAVTTADFW